tara:strand:+ start:23254 stop:24549 length:1296 start_codon:yes stop_codon:yes gene_type:complete
MKSKTLSIFKKSIISAHPSELFKKNFSILQKYKLKFVHNDEKKIYKIKFISFGKSGGTMAEEFLKIIGIDNVEEGIIVLPDYSKKLDLYYNNINICYSTHPFVSEKSVRAGKKVLDFADRCKEDEIVFCLISGGGSALLSSPVEGITVKDKVKLVNKLLKMGIGEREVNIIRKKLSNIKGGSLAKKIYPANIINLIISDEREHLLEAIASGPTIKKQSKVTAKDIISDYGLWEVIPKRIYPLIEGKKLDDAKPYPIIRSHIIGSREDLLNGIQKFSHNLDSLIMLKKFYDNNIINVKNELSNYYSNFYQKTFIGKHLIVACGEVPIKIPSKNIGMGGRNQHLTALMIEELNKYDNFEFLAISSDGCDFLEGVHGSVIKKSHLSKIKNLKININDYIANYNSYELHKQIGSLVEGPMTGTNVNDFYLFYFEK